VRAAIEDMLRSRLGRVLYCLLIVWALLAVFVKPVRLIEIENAFLIAAGFGVSVAYAPYAIQALRAKFPSQGEILALGIWLAWIAIAAERVYSLVGRAMGKDIVFFNTSLHTAFIYVTLLGGVCHLIAPEAVEDRLPRKAWIRMGIIVAIAVLILFGLAVSFGL
jgi:hypothetical protein